MKNPPGFLEFVYSSEEPELRFIGRYITLLHRRLWEAVRERDPEAAGMLSGYVDLRVDP